MPIIHQRVTCNNNLFQILADTGDNNNDDDTVVHISNCSPRVPLPDILEPHLPTAGPTPMPRLSIQCPGVFLKASPRLTPMPTVGPPKDTPPVIIHHIHPGRRKRARPISMTTPPRYRVIEPDEDRPDQPTTHVPTPPRHSTRIIQPKRPRQHLHPSYAPHHDARSYKGCYQFTMGRTHHQH